MEPYSICLGVFSIICSGVFGCVLITIKEEKQRFAEKAKRDAELKFKNRNRVTNF